MKISIAHSIKKRKYILILKVLILNNVYTRKGYWGKLLEILIDEPDYEWLMIDASHIKVHPREAGARDQDMSRTKGSFTPKYIWPWMRMVCQSKSLLQKVPEQIIKKLST